MDRRDFFKRLFGFGAAASALAALPAVSPASAAPLPSASRDPDLAVDKAVNRMEDGAEWAKGGKGRGKSRGRGRKLGHYKRR